MAKSLDQQFSESLGQLAVQNTLLRTQAEQLAEQAEALAKRVAELEAKYEPKATAEPAPQAA